MIAALEYARNNEITATAKLTVMFKQNERKHKINVTENLQDLLAGFCCREQKNMP